MKMKLTQYGWKEDPYMDSLTAKGLGAWDNHLTADSCALTKSAAAAIGAKPRGQIKIILAGGRVIFRRYDDKAPQNEPRCDLYMPKGFDKSLPDYAEVTAI